MARIALFLPNITPFYITLFFSIKKALESHGFQVIGWPGLLAGNELIEFCKRGRPDIVFEMNRTRSDIPEFPKDIIHIAWIVDNQGRKINTFSGSDIIYLFWQNWMKDCQASATKIMDWFPPGVDKDIYYPESLDFISDVSFVGHLSFPWTSRELKRVIYKSSDFVVTFADALRHLEDGVLKVDLTGFNEDDYIAVALSFLPESHRRQINLDNCVQYDLGCRAVLRMMFRRKLLDMAAACDVSLRFYGPGGWGKWDKYRPYYQTTLTDPDDIRRVYGSSRINLHEGVGVHFRTLDCMASGGLLFYLAGPDDKITGGIRTVFTPGIHYVEVQEANFSEKVAFYLAHPEERLEICDKASLEVLQKHTWNHRVQKLVDDLSFF
ncbi:glycosyltransferase family protein [Methylomonas fluvii]|uniref:Glycosyltransferase family 1 protein n=1 Tax=Methylomonas fluvii TaxID=1854564 RepID=A0ABR9DG16_9GAMM|nr:glycosyltransferase [Methylomonas fluvii]MBD9362044.1 glycosyltransferase family 1 protein [Methylomonas fluvii]